MRHPVGIGSCNLYGWFADTPASLALLEGSHTTSVG
jgi:hypothetical protein